MPRQQNKNALRYDNYEERVAKAIEDLKTSPESKISHIAAHYKLSRGTIYNRYYGRTQAARAAPPEELVLTPDQEESVERWVGKRDSLGYLPNHKELVRMVELMLNSDAEWKPRAREYHRLGDHYTV